MAFNPESEILETGTRVHRIDAPQPAVGKDRDCSFPGAMRSNDGIPADAGRRNGAGPAAVAPVRFSIAINNYNYGRFLAQAIDSCLAQTYAAHEIIVVDDGSTDNSREVLAGYRDNPKVRVILQENQGQAAALQHGIDAATGDWILGLDSDDYYQPDCLDEIARRIGPGVDWIYFACTEVDVTGRITRRSRPDPKRPPLAGQVWRQWMIQGQPHNFPPQSFHCYSRQFLRTIRLYPNPLVDCKAAFVPDRYLNLLASFDCGAAPIETSLGFYRRHADGDSVLAGKSLSRIQVRLRQQIVAEEIAHQKLQASGTSISPRFCIYSARAFWPLRLVSLVCDPAEHPYPHDRRLYLLSRILSAYMVPGPFQPLQLLNAFCKYTAVALTPKSIAWKIHLIKPRTQVIEWLGLLQQQNQAGFSPPHMSSALVTVIKKTVSWPGRPRSRGVASEPSSFAKGMNSPEIEGPGRSRRTP